MATQGIELPVSLQIKNLQDITNQLKAFAGKNLLADSLGGKKFEQELNKIMSRLEQISAKSQISLNTDSSFKSIQKDVDAIELGINRIQNASKNLRFEDLKIPDDIQSKIDGLNSRINQLQNSLISFKGTQKDKILNDQTFLSNLNIAEGPAAAAKILEKGYDELYKVINNKMTSINALLKVQSIAYEEAQKKITQNSNGKQSMTQWGAVSFLQDAFKQIPKEGKKNEIQELMSSYMKFDINNKGISEFSGFNRGVVGENRFLKELRARFELTPQQTQEMLQRMEEQAKTLEDGMKGVWKKIGTDGNFAANMLFGSNKTNIESAKNNYAEQLKEVERAKQELDKTQTKSDAYNKVVSAFDLPNKEIASKAQELAEALRIPQQELSNLKNNLLQSVQSSPQFSAAMTQAGNEVRALGLAVNEGEAKLARMNQTLNKLQGIQNFINRYIGVYAVVRKVSQFIKSAISNIKELDQSITNIAIVTNMSQKELWGKIGQYTQTAQQFGVATKDVYTVSQLFYQQGLQTNEVMALTTETLKMAKVSGMDYTEATNAMTVAIRAFNIDMENAAQVTDTYSALAAKFAVSSAEIANAMEKTASSAANVGMSLQTTSAFISVMEQTTREGAQNIGSALKSIISRYGEMKASPSTLLNVDGEEVAFNKVDTALKSIGISLKDSAGQFRDFDDVILELAKKWNTLDNNTQRYVATVMAGNRQQSRFIALVSNYDELKRAIDTSNNAENAGMVQTAKAMDSLESKANQLKNAFSQLYLDLHFEDALKGTYEWLTKLITLIGKLGTFSGILPTLFSVVNAGIGAKNLISMGKDAYQRRVGEQREKVEKLKIDKTDAENSLKELDEKIKQNREMPVKVKADTSELGTSTNSNLNLNIEDLKAQIQSQAAELGLNEVELKARLNLVDAIDPTVLGQLQNSLNSIDFTNPEWATNFRQNVEEIINGSNELAPKLISSFSNAGNSAIQGLLQSLSQNPAITAKITEIADIFRTGLNGVQETAATAFSQTLTSITPTVNFEGTMEEIKGQILNSLSGMEGIKGQIEVIGSDVALSLITGMLNSAGITGSAAQTLGQSILEGIRSSLDIHSPSPLIIAMLETGVGGAAVQAMIKAAKEAGASSAEIGKTVLQSLAQSINNGEIDLSGLQAKLETALNGFAKTMATHSKDELRSIFGEETFNAIQETSYRTGRERLGKEVKSARSDWEAAGSNSQRAEELLQRYNNLNNQYSNMTPENAPILPSAIRDVGLSQLYNMLGYGGRTGNRALRDVIRDNEVQSALEKQYGKGTVVSTVATQKAEQEEAAKKAQEEEAARKAQEEADRRARIEEEQRKVKEEAERRAKEAERKAQEEAAARRAREEAERKAAEENRYKEEQARLGREAMARVTAPVSPGIPNNMGIIMGVANNPTLISPTDREGFAGNVSPSSTPRVQLASWSELKTATSRETFTEANATFQNALQRAQEERQLKRQEFLDAQSVFGKTAESYGTRQLEESKSRLAEDWKVKVTADTTGVKEAIDKERKDVEEKEIKIPVSTDQKTNNPPLENINTPPVVNNESPLGNTPVVNNQPTPIPEVGTSGQLQFDLNNLGPNNLQVVPFQLEPESPEVVQQKVEQVVGQVTINDLLPVTQPVQADTNQAREEINQLKSNVESTPVAVKITTVQDMLNSEGWMADKGTIASTLVSEAPFLNDANYRQGVLNNLGLSQNDANYAAIDQFVAKIGEAANATGAATPELEELRKVAQGASQPIERLKDTTQQGATTMQQHTTVVGQDTNAMRTHATSGGVVPPGGAVPPEGNVEPTESGEEGADAANPTMRARFTNWRHNMGAKYGKHFKWKQGSNKRQGVMLASNIARLIAPVIIGASANYGVKDVEDIKNRNTENDKLIAGAGQGLSGAATGVSMGAMFGPWGAAIGGIAGFLAGGIGSILDGLKYELSEKLADARKMLDAAKERNQKQQARVTELSSSIDNIKELRKSMYNSQEDMDAYTSAMSSMAAQYPELISSYDAAGNAIINLIAAEKKLVDERSVSAQTAADQANVQVVTRDYELKVIDEVQRKIALMQQGFNVKGIAKELDEDYFSKYSDIFGGATEFKQLAGVLDYDDLTSSGVNKAAKLVESFQRSARRNYTTAKQERSTAERRQELYDIINDDVSLSYDYKNELESNESYLKLYETFYKKGGSKRDFLSAIKGLTETQREKLTSVNYGEFSNIDELLEYFDLQLEEDNALYKSFNQLLIDARKDNLDRFLSTVFNQTTGKVNSNLLGLKKILQNKNKGTWNDSKQEYTTEDQIMWIKERFMDDSDIHVLSIYSDFVTDQFAQINRFAEDGYTALAQARLNALDQIMYIVGQQTDDIQNELFNMIININFSNPEEINKVFDDMSSYANTHDEFQNKEGLETVRQSIINSINYNLNTIYEDSIKQVKDLSKKLNSSLSINKSGIEFEKAVEEFEEVVKLLSDGSDLNFNDLFVFDPILKKYVMTEEGLEKSIEARRSNFIKTKTDTEAKIQQRKELIDNLSGKKDNLPKGQHKIPIQVLKLPEFDARKDNDTLSMVTEYMNQEKVTPERIIELGSFLERVGESSDEFYTLTDEDKALFNPGNSSTYYTDSEEYDKHFLNGTNPDTVGGAAAAAYRKYNARSLDLISSVASTIPSSDFDRGLTRDTVRSAQQALISELFNVNFTEDEWSLFFNEVMSMTDDELANTFSNSENLLNVLKDKVSELKDVQGYGFLTQLESGINQYTQTEEIITFDSTKDFKDDKADFEKHINELMSLNEEDTASRQILQDLIEEFYTDETQEKTLSNFFTWLEKKQQSDEQLAEQIQAMYDAQEKDYQNLLFQNIEWNTLYTPDADITGRNTANMHALATALGLWDESINSLTADAIKEMNEKEQSLDEYIYGKYLETIYTKKVLDSEGNEVLDENGQVKTELDQNGYDIAMANYQSGKKSNLAQSATTAINEIFNGAGSKLSDTTRGLLKDAGLSDLDDQGLLAESDHLVQSAVKLYKNIEKYFNSTAEANEAYAVILNKNFEQPNQLITALSSGASMDVNTLSTTFTAFGLKLADFQDESLNWINGMNNALKTDIFGKTRIKDWDAFINIITQDSEQDINQIKDTFEYANAYSSYVDGIITLDTQFQDLITKSYDNAFNSVSLFKEMNVSQLSQDAQRELKANGAAVIDNGILRVTNALQYAQNAQRYFAELSAKNPYNLYKETGWTSEDLAKNWKAMQTVLTQSKDAWAGIGSNLFTITADQVSTLIDKGGLKIGDIGEEGKLKEVGDHYVMTLSDYALELAKAMSVNGQIDSNAYNKAMAQAQQAVFDNISGLNWDKVLSGTATDADLKIFRDSLKDSLSVLGDEYSEFITDAGQLDVSGLVEALSGIDEALANHIKETIADAQNNILSSISTASGYTYQGTNSISDMQKFVDEYNKIVENSNLSVKDAFQYDTNLNQFTLNADVLKTYVDEQRKELKKLGMSGDAINEYIKDQTLTMIQQNMDITEFINANNPTEKHNAANNLGQQIKNWYNAQGGNIADATVEKILSIIDAGGVDAVKWIKELKGDELTSDEIDAVYHAGINRINTAIESLEQGEGTVLTGMAANIAEVSDGIETTKLADGSVVITSVTNMADAYSRLYAQMDADSAKTTSQLNSLYAKFLTAIDQPETDAISVLNDAMGMSYEALGEMLAKYGVTLESVIANSADYGLRSLGNGQVQIYDFKAFASKMRWSPDSEAYTEAYKAYNDSLIALDKKIGENITEEVKAITEAKAGDRINVTYLVDKLGMAEAALNNVYFNKLGASVNDGILKISSETNIPELVNTIAQLANENAGLLPEELAELADAVNDYINGIIDLIKNGISGGLTNVQAQELQSWADQFNIKLDFTKTTDGLKLSQKQAIQLYNEIKKIDSIQANLVFNELNESLKESNEHYKSISDIQSRIAWIEDTDHPTRREQYAEELALAKEILAVRSTSEDEGFNFMSNKIPGAQNNPINYFNNWAQAIQTLDTALNKTNGKDKGLINYQDWYNIVTEMNNIAALGQDFEVAGVKLDGSMEAAAALIQKGAEALTVDSTGNIKVALGKIGVDFEAGSGEMSSGINAGIASMAKSQVKMLDGMIRLLEVIVQMEKLGDITGEDNTINFEDLYPEFKGDNLGALNDKASDWIDELFKASKNNEDLEKALQQIKVNGESIGTLLRRMQSGNISIENAKAMSKVLDSMWKMYQSGEWDLDNLYDSLASIAQESGLGEDLVIQLDNTTLIISGGQITQIDWEDSNTKEVLEKWKKETGKKQEDLQKEIQKYHNGQAVQGSTTLETILQIEDKLTIDQDKITANINGKSYTFNTSDTSNPEARKNIALWTALLDGINAIIPDNIDFTEEPYQIQIQTAVEGKAKVFVEYDSEGNRIYTDGQGHEGKNLNELALDWWNDEYPDQKLEDFSSDLNAKKEAYWHFGEYVHTETIVTVGDTKVDLKNPSDIRESVKKDLESGAWRSQIIDGLNPNGELELELGGAIITISGAEIADAEGHIDTSKLETYIREQLLGMDLGLKETISEGIKDAFTNIDDSKIEQVAKSSEDAKDKFDALKNDIQESSIEVKIDTETAASKIETLKTDWDNWTPKSKTLTTITNNTGNSDQPSSEGSNDAKGTVGLARAQGTLMGELGPELVVSNGRYSIVGQNGPEMVNLANDAIVFNHLQTKSLLEKGMSSGRGRAVTNERNAVSYAKGNIHGGPAKATATAALSTFKQLRAEWKALESLTTKDLAGKGGGGGGGGGDPKAFLKDLEKWYNWLQQIAQLEKEITYEETKRSKIQSDMIPHGQDYYKSQKATLDDLQKQLVVHQSLADSQQEYFEKRRKELNEQSAFSALYGFGESGQLYYKDGALAWLSDLTGRNATTGEANYTAKEQYERLVDAGFEFAMKYDSSGNEIKQEGEDWYSTALQAFWDKIDADKEEMQSLEDSIEEHKNAVLEAQSNINEIIRDIEDNQINVEQKVLKAIEDSRQREIDEFQKERDAIEKSSKALIDGLSEQLNLEKEMYSNQQEADEFGKLQRQLAILQRSGGSASQITDLQRQISEKQQNMYFDAQQQQIDALQKASDNQLERLDHQIDLMTEQLEYEKENGLLWNAVYEILQDPPESISQFIQDNTADYWGQSTTELAKTIREDLFEVQRFKEFQKTMDGGLDILTTLYGDEVARIKAEKEQAAAEEESETEEEFTPPTAEETDNGGGSSNTETTNNDNNDDNKGIIGSAIAKAVETELVQNANEEVEQQARTNRSQQPGASFLNALSTAIFRRVTPFASGGMDYTTGPAILHGTSSRPEAVLNSSQTAILRNDILSNKPTSLLSLLTDFRDAYNNISNATNSVIGPSDGGIIIENATVEMNVSQIANDYDAQRAGEQALDRMIQIARKSQGWNRIGG